jgi:hypothetical protein
MDLALIVLPPKVQGKMEVTDWFFGRQKLFCFPNGRPGFLKIELLLFGILLKKRLGL